MRQCLECWGAHPADWTRIGRGNGGGGGKDIHQIFEQRMKMDFGIFGRAWIKLVTQKGDSISLPMPQVTMKRTFSNGEWKCLPDIFLGVAKMQLVEFSHVTRMSFYKLRQLLSSEKIRSALLKHGDHGGCATNRKVAGSIPAVVIGIFYWHKTLPIALWPWDRFSLYQKWVPGAFPGDKGGRCVRLKPTTVLCHCHEIWKP